MWVVLAGTVVRKVVSVLVSYLSAVEMSVSHLVQSAVQMSCLLIYFTYLVLCTSIALRQSYTYTHLLRCSLVTTLCRFQYGVTEVCTAVCPHIFAYTNTFYRTFT